MRSIDPVRHLSARLLTADGATQALAAWCDEHGIGDGPILAERRLSAGAVRPDDALLDWLLPGPAESIRHRRVTLTRDGIALSDCELWWLPGRLDPDLVAALDGTQRPFGAVVARLRPTRRTIFEAVLAPGLPHVLEHRALVLASVGMRQPIAATRELYRAALVARPAAPARSA